MAKPVLEAKNKLFSNGFTEIVERGEGWLKCRKPGTNKFAIYIQEGNTGWHRGLGPFTEEDEIDTDWQPTTGTWDFEMTKADYQAYIDNSGNYQYTDFLTGESVSLNVTFFGWTNDEGQSQQIPFNPTVPTVSGDVLTWNELFGVGTSLRIQTQTARLAKYLDFENLSNLPVPTIGSTNIKLTMSYTLSHSNGVDIYVDGQLWDENSTIDTMAEVEFRQILSGQPIWYFEIPRAWDNSFERVSHIGTQTLKQAGANLFVDAHIPYSWIIGATFPITIDPSVTPQVGASADDAFTDGSSNTTSITTANQYLGDGAVAASYRRATGTRFQVNASGTCDLAYIEVCPYGNQTINLPIDTAADDVDNASQWVTNLAIENQITSTSAVLTTHSSYSYVADTFARAGGASQDIKNVVQEIFDRPGWAANQYIRFAFLGQRVQDYLAMNTQSYDQSTSLCPRLYLEYTDVTYQFIRPSSDISSGTWTPSTGATLYGVLDETTPDDGDYAASGLTPSSDTMEVKFSSGSDPGVGTNHIVNYRYKKAGTQTINLTFSLMQGTTQIATWSHNGVSTTITAGEYTLSEAEANSITDYTDLRLRVVANVP